MGVGGWLAAIAARLAGRRRGPDLPSSAPLTDQELDDYLALLAGKGWKVERAGGGAVALSDSFRRRYPKVPAEYLGFLQRVASCVNPDETVWFLCADDYNGTAKSEWAWNELEKIGLEGAQGEEADEIRDFWDRHLPFMYSVGSEYAFLAFRVTDEGYGSVVDAYELDLTEVSDVAATFAQLVRLHGAAVEGRPGVTMLGDYV